MLTQQITYLNQQAALVIHGWYESPGIRFFTNPEDPLQVAWMKWQIGHKIFPHIHTPTERNVVGTAEVLLLRKGRVRLRLLAPLMKEESPSDASLCTGEGMSGPLYKEIGETVLESGAIAILMPNFGHSIEIMEEAEMWEVKQGPFTGDDKTHLYSIELFK